MICVQPVGIFREVVRCGGCRDIVELWVGLEAKGPAYFGGELGCAEVDVVIIDFEPLVDNEEELVAGFDDPADATVPTDGIGDIVVLGEVGP